MTIYHVVVYSFSGILKHVVIISKYILLFLDAHGQRPNELVTWQFSSIAVDRLRVYKPENSKSRETGNI